MPKNAYIHIPFCKSKCKYCSFLSFTDLSYIDDYINALFKDITYNYDGELLNTIYFGGGTPSLLQLSNIQKILKNLNYDKNIEITFELNPDDISLEYLKELRKAGINRLSIGSQSFDNNILKLIGRRHSASAIEQSVLQAKNAGFENISLDLIYGLPTQTTDSLKNDLDKILNLNIKHISTYGLKIEEGSYFYKNTPEKLPDNDAQADMYLMINEVLEKSGFYRYEISNFSKKGYESKHNLNYWNNNEYYGFGLGAHGYKNSQRYSNQIELNEYIKLPTKPIQTTLLKDKEKLEEEIFLGFRKTEGININSINKKFNIDFEKKYSDILNKFSPNYIEKTTEGYALTLQGILLSNHILSEFIDF